MLARGGPVILVCYPSRGRTSPYRARIDRSTSRLILPVPPSRRVDFSVAGRWWSITFDAALTNQREKIVALAAAHRLPAIFPNREYAVAGGLASYGARWADMYRVIGAYAGRILMGAKPADLPVQRPTT